MFAFGKVCKQPLLSLNHNFLTVLATPDMLTLSYSEDGKAYRLAQTKTCPVFVNTRHDAYVDHVLFADLEAVVPKGARYVKLSYTSESKTAVDKFIVNPEL